MPLKHPLTFMRPEEQQRSAGRAEERSEISSAHCNQEVSCAHPPSPARPGPDSPLGGSHGSSLQRKLAKNKRLVIECRKDGLKAKTFSSTGWI